MKRSTRLALFLVGTFAAVASAAWCGPARAGGLDGGVSFEPGQLLSELMPELLLPEPIPQVVPGKIQKMLADQCRRQAPRPCILPLLIGNERTPEVLAPISADQFRMYLSAAHAAGAKAVVVGFLSPGGYFGPAQSIINAIRAETIPVACVAHRAESSAFWIYEAACPVRYVVPDAMLMTHEVYYPAGEEPLMRMEDLERRLKLLRSCNQIMAGDVGPRLGMTPSSYLARIHAGDWKIPADKAVELRVADRVVKNLAEATELFRATLASKSRAR